MENKIKRLLELVEKYDSSRTIYSLDISIYGNEWVISYKKLNFEWYGETLEKTVDEAIEGFDEMIKDRDDEEREYLEQREKDYWEVQGAKSGKINCF